MVDSGSPHAIATAVLSALDARRWSEVAAHCSDASLTELQDSVVRFIQLYGERQGALAGGVDAFRALREYGDDIVDAAALQALTPRAFFTRDLLRREANTPSTGPRTIEEVSVAGDEAMVRYIRPGAGSEGLRLVRLAGYWQAVPNDDMLGAVRLSLDLWRRRFEPVTEVNSDMHRRG